MLYLVRDVCFAIHLVVCHAQIQSWWHIQQQWFPSRHERPYSEPDTTVHPMHHKLTSPAFSMSRDMIKIKPKEKKKKPKKLKTKNPLKYPNHLDANWGLTHPTTCAFISSQAWNMLLNKKFVLTTCLKQKWNSDVTGCNNSQI